MVTGYQRQHRKSVNYIPCEGADPHTTDQYTRIVTHVNNQYGINEQYSKGCEQSAITGLVLAQPYLDYRGDDPLQGELKLKIWEYNSFLVDPYFREPDMSDAQFVWCQEYISKKEAEFLFPDKMDQIRPMAGTPQRYGSFYFLPENYNMARNDLMVLSYVWYKWQKKKKRLYIPQTHQFHDFAGGQEQEDEIRANIPGVEFVTQDAPTWKLAVILNDQLMSSGPNPLGFDDCPFVPIYWNYEPHINYYDLRARGLVRCMRDSNFLLNRRIILNHDISESSINTGWKRKVGAVANEDNLKRSGQGYDVLINDGYELTDVEKIIPNAVPPSDMELANQMADLIFRVSGVNMENWTMDENKELSGLAMLIKQGGNLLVLQKYFDQWDQSFKLIGERELQVILNNWSAEKVALYLGEQPSPHFFSKVFAKYNVLVEEGLNTATQKQQQFKQWMDLNAALNGVIPPSVLAKKAAECGMIQGADELMQIFEQQEQQAAAMQQHTQMMEQNVLDAQLKELYSRAVANISTAKERQGRSESNIGLFEERLSQISQNHAMSMKAKAEALAKLVEVTQAYGNLEAHLSMNNLQTLEDRQEDREEQAKRESKQTSMANDFTAKILAGMMTGQGEMGGEMQQMNQAMQPQGAGV